jgi:hypothetical protein
MRKAGLLHPYRSSPLRLSESSEPPTPCPLPHPISSPARASKSKSHSDTRASIFVPLSSREGRRHTRQQAGNQCSARQRRRLRVASVDFLKGARSAVCFRQSQGCRSVWQPLLCIPIINKQPSLLTRVHMTRGRGTMPVMCDM